MAHCIVFYICFIFLYLFVHFKFICSSDLFSRNTSFEDFVIALQQDPPRKSELSNNRKESLLVCVAKLKDVDKLKYVVSLGCVIDENIAAEKCQGSQNKVKFTFCCSSNLFFSVLFTSVVRKFVCMLFRVSPLR